MALSGNTYIIMVCLFKMAFLKENYDDENYLFLKLDSLSKSCISRFGFYLTYHKYSISYYNKIKMNLC